MSEPILTQAHNIYEQQVHNRRMTWLLMGIFIFLIAVIGSGFDVFFNVSPVARIIILPFVILMVGSGIWNFRQRAAEGLWKKPQAFADDEEEDPDKLFGPLLKITIITMLFLLFLFVFFFYPGPFIRFFTEDIDIPLLRYIPVGTTLAVIIGIVSILTSLRWGMNSVLWSVHAEQPDKTIANLPELLDVVKEMSLAAGLSCPKVYTVNDSDPNAFTIGTNPQDSSIVVTTGLLEMLDREELQAVIAHEMSHIRNADTRLMTTITGTIWRSSFTFWMDEERCPSRRICWQSCTRCRVDAARRSLCWLASHIDLSSVDCTYSIDGSLAAAGISCRCRGSRTNAQSQSTRKCIDENRKCR